MDKTYWFLCTKQDHCSNGHMKFQVLVKMPTHVIDQWDVNQNFENISVNVGDTLAFDYKDTDHDVQMFASEDAYNNCDFAGATSECGEEGPCTIKITSGMQGQTYFGCSKSDHCQTGNQKMALTVESGAETVTASLATVLLGSLALLWTNKRL
jgi:plastocyanin